MISFQKVNKTFKSELFTKPFQALKDLSFNITPGKVTGFLGANGAGKTTSLKILMNFVKASSGEIKYHPDLGKDFSEIFQSIGFLPEKAYFYPYLTGREFCYYMGELMGMDKMAIASKIDEWAPKFKIDFALDRKIRTYSKGMLQRVGFLVTLLHNPKMVILDEPLSGLDPIGRKELKDIILELKSLGKTIFFSSHIVSDVEEVSDEVIFIKNGELVYEGSVHEILSKSQTNRVEIKYFSDSLQVLEVEKNKVNESLSKIIAQGQSVVSVNNTKKSLEEVFYNV